MTTKYTWAAQPRVQPGLMRLLPSATSFSRAGVCLELTVETNISSHSVYMCPPLRSGTPDAL